MIQIGSGPPPKIVAMPRALRCIVTLICLVSFVIGSSRTALQEDSGVYIDGIVSMGLWQGLNNQRLCVTPSFLMAERLGYAVLLPYWRLDFLGENSDADRGLVPFTYLFKVRCVYISVQTADMGCQIRWINYGSSLGGTASLSSKAHRRFPTT